MTNFNDLPLAEKIKNAMKGDVVVTDSGARIPVYTVDSDDEVYGFEGSVSSCYGEIWFKVSSITDIIRPSEKHEVPITRETCRSHVGFTEEELKSAMWEEILKMLRSSPKGKLKKGQRK